MNLLFHPIQRMMDFVIPPAHWRLPVLVLLGTFAGLGGVVLQVSNALSYLSDDPTACVNCHIMAPEYATWQRGSHGRNTTCNDCHVPHDNLVRKYWFKATDGLRHATLFTLRLEPQVIWAKAPSADVIQENCLRCHADRMRMVQNSQLTVQGGRQTATRPCRSCHRETPHGRVHSLSSTPFARVPVPTPVTPAWMTARQP